MRAGGRGGGHSIQLFKELFSQPKLDIFRGVQGYGLGDTKSVDTPVSLEIGYILPCKKTGSGQDIQIRIRTTGPRCMNISDIIFVMEVLPRLKRTLKSYRNKVNLNREFILR